MAQAKFTIVNSTLQISVGATNVLYLPTLYIGVQSISLYEATPRIVLFNTAQGNNLTVFEGDLSECTDSAGTPFTLSTFLTFASTYFGTSSSSATPTPVSPRPNNTGANGTTPYKLISTASTNSNNIKSSGGNLYCIIAIGLTSTVRYLKIYSKATAPTVGTDVPLMTIPVPANTQGAGVAIPFSMGVNFPLGIGIAITSGSADNDTGAVGAGDVIVNLTYA
jgi:hypothetical protein